MEVYSLTCTQDNINIRIKCAVKHTGVYVVFFLYCDSCFLCLWTVSSMFLLADLNT